MFILPTMSQTRRLNRRQFLKFMLGASAGAAGAALGGSVYTTLIEPQWLSIERIDVPLARLPRELDGFTIAQLSDLHLGPYIGVEEIRSAVAATNQLRPDSIPVLINEALPVERHGARLWIAGVDDVWERRADLDSALRQVPSTEPTVLLAHEPDYAEVVRRYPVDLQLSGHSHGGQVRLPFYGAPILPFLAKKYPIGLQRADAMWVYTNRGIGVVSPPVRFNCRPEITLLTLRHRIATHIG